VRWPRAGSLFVILSSPQPINYELLAGQSFARFFRVFSFITLTFITNRLILGCLPCVQLLVCTYRVWPPSEGGVAASNFPDRSSCEHQLRDRLSSHDGTDRLCGLWYVDACAVCAVRE
jgi:hypothetical protein